MIALLFHCIPFHKYHHILCILSLINCAKTNKTHRQTNLPDQLPPLLLLLTLLSPTIIVICLGSKTMAEGSMAFWSFGKLDIHNVFIPLKVIINKQKNIVEQNQYNKLSILFRLTVNWCNANNIWIRVKVKFIYSVFKS